MSNNGKFQQVNVTNGTYPELDELVVKTLDFSDTRVIRLRVETGTNVTVHTENLKNLNNRVIEISDPVENRQSYWLSLEKNDIVQINAGNYRDNSKLVSGFTETLLLQYSGGAVITTSTGICYS